MQNQTSFQQQNFYSNVFKLFDLNEYVVQQWTEFLNDHPKDLLSIYLACDKVATRCWVLK